MLHHSNFWVCRLTPEQHARTCNYWYTVTSGSMAHTAFTHRHHLDAWLSMLGLSLDGPLSDSEWQCVRAVGSYRTKMCYSAEDVAAFHAATGVETRWMSNAQYTLAKIVTDDDGIKTVWYLNPNVKDRPVYDYPESRQLVG
jgi:hypothetical protein